MKLNNYLFTFAGILAFLVLSHLFVVYKYFQILVHHSIYYCQEMVKALNLGLPGDLGKVVFGLLVLAFLFTFVRLLGTVFKIYSFRKTLFETKVWKENSVTQLLDKLNLRSNVKILNQKKPQAFCFGILGPKIYISTGLLKLMSDRELEVILRHEKYHLESKDSLTLLLATLVESLFPFFPILSDFIKIYRTDRELNADQTAIKGVADKKSLSEVLKKLIQYEPVISPTFTSGIISTDTLEARIQSLMSLKMSYKKFRRRSLFVSFVSLFALVALMVTPVKAVELHEEGHDLVLLCNETTSCESVCRQHSFMQLQSKTPLYTPVNSTPVN